MLGTITAMIHVIEFQKCGLPHAHILIILDNALKLRTEEDIDKMVWAEVPDETQYPGVHELVLSHMMHGPCGLGTNSPCMKIRKCKKGFPKASKEHTLSEENGYPMYKRRRNDAFVVGYKFI